MIPKIIHYCWFGPKPFSRTVRKCIATWHKHLSDYEFCLWNEDTCTTYAAAHNLPNPMEHPFVVGAYVAKKYAFVADYVRFWALYHCGGVYLDTDMYVIRNMDDMLDADFFAAWENTTMNIVSCGVLGASQECACIEQILAKYDILIFDANYLDQFIVPRIITPIVLGDHTAKIYPYDYFYPFPYDKRQDLNFIRYKTNSTFAIHLWDLSWKPWYTKWIGNIVRICKTIKHNLCALR